MDPVQKTKLQQQLTAAITAAVSMKADFELYAYRIITPEQFIERVDEVVNTTSRFLEEANDIEEEQPMQTV